MTDKIESKARERARARVNGGIARTALVVSYNKKWISDCKAINEAEASSVQMALTCETVSIDATANEMSERAVGVGDQG